ncbi:MAG TPA: N-acetyltransferase [Candidatus Limnocylindrales bacterium]|nr:N-acetyltransferase [Candidatus Limnocylindrales bacterium]
MSARGEAPSRAPRRSRAPASAVRRARSDDAPAIHAIIHGFASQDLLLPRPLADIYDRIRDFWVVEEGGRIVGCAALRIWWHDLGEVRSLAVAEEAAGRGHGAALVRTVEEEAARYGLRVAFALTRVEDFFARQGYTVVDRAVLYQKVWGDCARCPKRYACDEVAVVKALVPGAIDRLISPDPVALQRVEHVVPPRAPGMPERLIHVAPRRRPGVAEPEPPAAR